MNKAKKFLIGLLAFASISSFAFGITACKDGGETGGVGGHTHVYDQEIATEEFLKSLGSCTSKPTYYKSCECGAKGTATFEYGDFGHVDNNDGTCSVCSKKYYSAGLEYELSEDETYYIVAGLGECTDTDLIIRASYNHLPVTTIGERAFSECDNLKSIRIGNLVTTIGDSAFSYCEGLTSVTIGNSVTTIGNSAFRECYDLTSVTIPNSVTTIGDNAFYRCNGLIYNIKENVKYLGNENNPYIYLVGMVVETATNVMIDNTCKFIGSDAFYDCESLTSVAIPDSVTTIGNSAFYGCDNLVSISIGNSVKSIENMAFYDCDKLVNISISNSVTTIGSYAFYGCDSLTSITIPDSVTTIGGSAFENCYRLKNVAIGNSVTTIGYGTFANCSNLTYNEKDNLKYLGNDINPYICLVGMVDKTATSVTIEDSCKLIGSDAFRDCASLTSVTIGNLVTAIGSSAFYGCDNLVSIYYTGNIAGWCNITFDNYSANPLSNGADFYINHEKVVDLVIPDGVETINKYAFQVANFESVTIGDSVTTIGYNAFRNSDSLTSVTIGNSVTTIGDSAFAYCASLTSVTIGNSVTTIEEGAFYHCDKLESVTIPDSVKTIGDSAFDFCKNLTSVTIGNSVTTIGDSAFDFCKNLTSVTIGNSVTTIESNAFSWCGNLTSVTIPDSVTTIGSYAFFECGSLTSVTIGNSVKTIGDSAFCFCYRLTEVYNKSSLNITAGSSDNGYVGNYALNVYTEENGSKLSTDSDGYVIYTEGDEKVLVRYTGEETELILPDGITQVGKYSFNGCSNLTSITIPDSVTKIEKEAFSGCTALTSVYYTGDIAGWCGIDFVEYNYANPLRNGADLYINNEKVVDLVIPDGVEMINEYAFQGANFESVTIPDSVTTIGDCAFDCYSSSVYYTGNIAGWCAIDFDGYSANPLSNGADFYINHEKIGDLVIPDGVETINQYAFYNYTSLESVTIGNSVATIGNDAFIGCTSLTSVTISDSVKTIGDRAFSVCNSLTSITFTGTVEEWNAIEKGLYWKYNVPATKVVCSDGEVEL